MATSRSKSPRTTRLADDTSVDQPQSTDAYDAPADTYDPKERASSARPDKAAAAAAGHKTVNAVTPVESIPDDAPTSQGRTETYTAYKSDGTEVQVTHDLDTGETTVAEG